MTRRLIALSIAALLMVALVPAVAFASAKGTAGLTAGKELFPTANTTYKISVANGEPALIGKRVNFVNVILPSGTAGVVLNDDPVVAPTGWTATKVASGPLQQVRYTTSGAGLAPGQSLEFSFPATVKRPASSDRSGTFQVNLSSDGGATTQKAALPTDGTLTTTVRILQLEALAPTAPAGVTDRSATGGQQITYGTAIRNHALNAVTVISSLSSPIDLATPSKKSVSVPGNPEASTPVSHTFTLKGATADRQEDFTATATTDTGTATAKPVVDRLSVEVPALVDFLSIAPNRVRSGTAANYTFKVQSAKSGTPGLTIESGSLTFAGTTTALDTTVPVTYDRGARNRELSFEEVEVQGTSGKFTPTITLAGVDANGFAFNQTKSVLEILIDNLAPIITVDALYPKGQSAVKNGDTVRVDGTITNAGDLKTDSMNVQLVPDVGSSQTVPVTLTKTGDETYTFSGTTAANFEKPAEDRTGGARTFVAKAEAADTAGNIGGDVSPTRLIDNLVPYLLNPGQMTSNRELRITFVDDLATSVQGGCDENAYRIDGAPATVTEVRFPGEEESCEGKTAASGARILILRQARDQDAPPTVTYAGGSGVLNSSPAQDGALNNAVQQTIDTITTIVPAAPQIVSVSRNGGSETAYSETGADKVNTYFTRFPGTGDDTTEDLELTFSGARNGYTIQVLDQSGAVINSKELRNPAILPGSSREFQDSIRIPIGTTDGSYARSIRLVGNNLEGLETDFNVTLDQVVPAIGSAAANGNEVTVTFSEIIVAGTDFASDWYAYENVSTTEGPYKQHYLAENVEKVDATTRLMTFGFGNEGPFGGVDYLLQSSSGERYEDRAGNLLADTLG